MGMKCIWHKFMCFFIMTQIFQHHRKEENIQLGKYNTRILIFASPNFNPEGIFFCKPKFYGVREINYATNSGKY